MTNPQSSAVPPHGQAAGIGVHTVLFLIVGYAAMAVHGVEQLSPASNPLLTMTLSLIHALNLGLWAVRDARRRRHAIPLLAQDFFVVFAWLLVPIYAIQSRGWLGLMWVIIHAIGWVITLYAAFFLTLAIVYR